MYIPSLYRRPGRRGFWGSPCHYRRGMGTRGRNWMVGKVGTIWNLLPGSSMCSWLWHRRLQRESFIHFCALMYVYTDFP